MIRAKLWWLARIAPVVGLAVAVGCSQAPDPAPVNGHGKGAQPVAAAEPKPAEQKPAETAVTPAPAKPAATPAAKPVAGTATIIGKVVYAGDPPKRRLINFGAEKKCHEGHDTPPMDESIVVNPADKGIQWVLVRVAGKVPGTFAPPTAPAVYDQKGCVFSPHVLAVQTGQEIDIRNSDPVLHNVRAEATLNQGFNRNLPKPGDALKVKFDAAEVGIKVKCDVHFWMEGYIHVLPHPFFAVTGADGGYTIAKLPPGTHKLEAWHEKLGKQVQEITVKDGEVKTVEFTFKPKS